MVHDTHSDGIVGCRTAVYKLYNDGYQTAVGQAPPLPHLCHCPLALRSGHGFSLDSDEREGDEQTIKQRPVEERRERPEELQRSSWERKTPTDDKRRKREDSEPRLFMACDDGRDTQDPLEGADKSGMTVNCN